MAITELSPLIAGVVIGALWQVLVIFGMHWGLVPVTINNLATLKFDTFTPLILPPVIAQGGAALAVMLKTKDKKKKQLAGSGTLTALFGITEPTIYGVTLPQKKPFIAGCIGGAIGGGLMGVMGVKAFSQVMPSILVLPAFISTVEGVQSSLFWAIISVVVAFVSAFVLTLVMDIGSTEVIETPVEEENSLKNEENEILVSPMTGKVIPLSEVEDAVFASEAMGKGIAIVPEIGELKAPASGVITTVFPTGHAIGMTTDQGAEILMHIGIDTVELKGLGFEKRVAQGERVLKGQLLATFDIATLEKQGKSTSSPMVITNSSDYLDVLSFNQTEVVAGEDCLTLIK